MSYIVVDTEGRDFITEIAIVNSDGEVIYEKFLAKKEDIKECFKLLNNKTIVAHSADHDKKLLEKNFAEIGLKFQATFICTFQEARRLLDLDSYSLEALSFYFDLKDDNNRFFSEELFAHRARYDAIFTYKLYKKLMEVKKSREIAQVYNPFSSSKVDNPFQEHFDYKNIYKDEFNYLISILNEVKNDKNHQTKSVVVLGEAGSGKTHFMMRFVKHISKTNRFLFIRQPNDENSVIFHIYARILESFVKTISNSDYSQLEFFLAKSISAIIISRLKKRPKLTESQLRIINYLEENHLNIYIRFGGQESNWRTITKVMLDWWQEKYSNNEIAINLLKALIKYVQYKDRDYKELVMKYISGFQLSAEELDKISLERWNNNFSREEFSLEAISLFGKLSLFDEPMILCFDQLESLINNNMLLKNFGEALKEIITQTPNSLIVLNLFPDRWNYFLNFFDSSVNDRIGQEIISLSKIDSAEMKNLLKKRAESYKINLDYIFDYDIYQKCSSSNSIRRNINLANHYFKYKIHKIPLPNITTTLEEEFRLLLERVEEIEKIVGIKKNLSISKPDRDLEEYLKETYEKVQKRLQNFTLVDDSDEYGKLRTIFYTLKTIYGLETDFFKIKKRALPPHLNIIKGGYKYSIGFLNVNGNSFSSRLKNYTALMLNFPDYKFYLLREDKKVSIRGKEFVKQFNQKGTFIFVEREDKIIFETFHQIVEEYNNKDLDFELKDVFSALFKTYPDFWLTKILKR